MSNKKSSNLIRDVRDNIKRTVKRQKELHVKASPHIFRYRTSTTISIGKRGSWVEIEEGKRKKKGDGYNLPQTNSIRAPHTALPHVTKESI